MKQSLVRWLCCPKCGGSVSTHEERYEGGEIESGIISCDFCHSVYPIIRFVPRFVSQDNYTSNFGFQWNRFRRTQLDSFSATTISRDRFFKQTQWKEAEMKGSTILDVGCGAGRFTEIALSTGAQVFAVDYSTAVDACWENFRLHPNLHVIQADIYALPFKSEYFDYIYCFGVLQHTPDPQGAFKKLVPKLKNGGQIAIDVYWRHWGLLFYPKYWLRPITTRLPRKTLFRLVERSVPFLLSLSRVVGHMPAVGRILRRLLLVANYEGIYPLDPRQLHTWAVLDTFDMLSPMYDKPQTRRAVRSWLMEARLQDVRVFKAAHLVGKGRKRSIVGA